MNPGLSDELPWGIRDFLSVAFFASLVSPGIWTSSALWFLVPNRRRTWKKKWQWNGKNGDTRVAF